MRWTLISTLVAAAALGAAPLRAQDDDGGGLFERDPDEFETEWIGLRLGGWYRPLKEMRIRANGRVPGTGIVVGDRFDVEDDLGVGDRVDSDWMFRDWILEGEAFVDTRWISISVWGVAPFEYRGRSSFRRSVSFGGQTFAANMPTESRFEQWFAGVDVKGNIFNNAFFALSPLIGARVIGIDWEVRAGQPVMFRADTSMLDFPIEVGDFQVIPYPVVGLEVKAGWRQWVEVDAKVAGVWVEYGDIEGGSVQADAGLTFWPIPWVGLRIGGRYTYFDFEHGDRDDTDYIDFDLEYLGGNASLILRI